MLRVKFKTSKSREEFFNDLRSKCGVNWKDLANKLNVNPRTFYDWKNGRTAMPVFFLQKCTDKCSLKLANYDYTTFSENKFKKKAAIKGGNALIQKRGNPGTSKGRRKGGRISQKRRKENPVKYRNCNLRKEINIPENSEKLSEFIGLFLGDGGISKKNQAVVTLNKQKDSEYMDFVYNLIKDLFDIEPAIYSYNTEGKRNVKTIVINSRNAVDFLLGKGLIIGNKVKKQVKVPKWIVNNKHFSKACLRGLIDTDGGVFYRKRDEKIKGIGLVFTNKSKPLINFAEKMLTEMNFTPKISSRKMDVLLYRNKEVVKYFNRIGFNNPYKEKRVEKFINGGVG